LIREVAALAAARNVSLSDRAPLPVATLATRAEPEAVAMIQAAGQQLKASAPQHRMSTLQDLNAGRPLEVDETLGYAASEAARLNVAVPLLRNVCALVAGIGRCGSSDGNAGPPTA
jgi:ketopantoate reductase